MLTGRWMWLSMSRETPSIHRASTMWVTFCILFILIAWGPLKWQIFCHQVTLFHDGVEDYATANTTLVSEEVQSIARDTNEAGLFAPCMVGTLESQFLKLQVRLYRKKCFFCSKTLDSLTAWMAGVQLNSVFLFSPSQAVSESRIVEQEFHFLR